AARPRTGGPSRVGILPLSRDRYVQGPFVAVQTVCALPQSNRAGRAALTLPRLTTVPMNRTDEELVAGAQAGDLDCFNQLVSRWERPIFALAYRTIGR